MNLFITGGTGFFGKALLNYLRDSHFRAENNIIEVVILSRNPESFLACNPCYKNLAWLDFKKGNILERESFPSKNFDYVLHAAADSVRGTGEEELKIFEEITSGTKNILEFSIKRNAKKFLFVSSGAVYGPQPQYLNLIPENFDCIPDPLSHNSAYGIAKRQAENLCAIYRHIYGLDFSIARCFAFVGEDLPINAHFAVGNFIRDALYSNEITISGDGTPLRSYLYQEDLAKWLMTILLSGKPGCSYNVGSDESISIIDLANLIRAMICPDKSVLIGRQKDNFRRNKYVPDITKAKKELGLVIDTTLVDALKKTTQRLKG